MDLFQGDRSRKLLNCALTLTSCIGADAAANLCSSVAHDRFQQSRSLKSLASKVVVAATQEQAAQAPETKNKRAMATDIMKASAKKRAKK